MKILLVHPGHTFATADVFDGLAAGFAAAGAEVVPFRWDKILNTVGGMVQATQQVRDLDDDRTEHLRAFGGWLAAADALTTAMEHAVDAVFVVNGMLFPAQRAYALTRLGIPVCCYGTEAPYFHEQERAICGAYTHWFTQERRSVDAYRPHARAVHYLPMAYNPATHHPAPPDPSKACDVVFVGGGYPERKALLDGVDWTGIHMERRGTLWDIDWANPPRAEPGGTVYSKGAIPNTETTAWHQSAAISLNIHRHMTTIESRAGIAPGLAESLGPRAYEIPAVGGFMLCDDERPELFDVYGEAAASFRACDSADLERQVRYWLAHPDERERRRRAQLDAVQAHSWTARAAQVLSLIA